MTRRPLFQSRTVGRLASFISNRLLLPELLMDTSTTSFALTGVVPPVCDAEAGQTRRIKVSVSQTRPQHHGTDSEPRGSDGKQGLAVRKIRSVMAELCSAVRSALDDERMTAEDSLRRAAEILREIGEPEEAASDQARGGLSPWQIRKVTAHIEAHLDRPIRNEDLAAIVRLNPSHFCRAFRNSLGEPPHAYVIRRRVERAQGLMLSTDASLSDIALDCGLADQSHLTRLFRRIVGDSPRAWRRARLSAPV
jgi:AraC family transcriptional regulator